MKWYASLEYIWERMDNTEEEGVKFTCIVHRVAFSTGHLQYEFLNYYFKATERTGEYYFFLLIFSYVFVCRLVYRRGGRGKVRGPGSPGIEIQVVMKILYKG